MSYRFADCLRAGSGRNCSSALILWHTCTVSKPVWHIPLLCVQWKSPDDGQRNCPKHVEFYSKNKLVKLVHLVSFIIRIYHDARSPERQRLTYNLILLLFALCLPLWCVTAFCVRLNSFRTFVAILIVKFIYGWLLSWHLIISENWSSLYFVFIYSAVFIVAALCFASVCNKPLLPLLCTYSPSVSAFRWCTVYIVLFF